MRLLGHAPLKAQVTGLANRHPAREYRPPAGQDHEDPFGGSAPDLARPGREAGESACPKRTSAGGRGAAEWPCPSVRPADWVEQKRLAEQPAVRTRAWGRVEAAPTTRQEEAQSMVLLGGAGVAFPRWR